MAPVTYCTREDVKAALDVKLTARADRQVDRAIESGAREVEGLTHRTFRPVLATRYFDWPNHQYAAPWRLWLDGDELISLTTLVAGGTTIAASDYFLEPVNTGPPYSRIEVNLASSAAFSSGDTHQRAIAATGLFGWRNDEEQVGDLTSNLDASTSDTADATWLTADIGVGDVLRIDSERMIVRDKTMVDSGQNTAGALTASAADNSVLVANASAFAVRTVLRVDSERMLVVDRNTTTNALTVRRAWDGTVLAAHSSGADVFTLTGVDLDRAQLGTTLAAHTTGADIYRHLVPGGVRELNIAEAINTIQQEGTGYARRSGLGEQRGTGKPNSDVEASGRGLDDLREQVYAAFARKARTRAI